jgi:hypothetical protein
MTARKSSSYSGWVGLHYRHQLHAIQIRTEIRERPRVLLWPRARLGRRSGIRSREGRLSE